MTTKIPVELSSTPGIVDGSNATAITIDSSENVGIGISPSNTFSVGASGTVTTRYTSTDTSAFSLLQFENSGSIVLSADHGDSASSTEILFKTDGATERAKIDSNGDAQFQNRIFAGGGTGANTSVNADDLVLGLTNNSTERGITIASTAGGGIRWNDGADAGTLQYVHSTNRMQFYTAGALDVSIDSDGIKFGSDTAAANALDDYEEGTWTPVYDGATSASGVAYTSRVGSYTKIGNTVTVSCNMVLSNKGTVAGVNRISGLPFAGNNSPAFHVIAPLFGNLDLDANQQGTGAQYAVNSFVYLFVTENDTALAQMTSGQVNNNTDFHFTLTYMTNS